MTTPYEVSPCPACGGESCATLADGAAIRTEVEALWDFHLRRLRPGVPTERLLDRVVFSQDAPLQLVRCDGCRLVYRNPRERARALVEGYASETPDDGARDALFANQLGAARAQAARLARVAGSIGAGLEVGGYLGAFLAAAGERGWRFRGIDVNREAIRYARSRGLEMEEGTLESHGPPESCDAVALWNCFEQLPEPRDAVHAARELLVPGGILVARVPNGGFYARWRTRLSGPLGGLARTLLAHNNLLGFPYRHGFTPRSLRMLLETARFRVVAVHGDALVPVADRWTRGWAAWEERAVKRALRATARPESAPWIEVYARAVA